MAGSLSIHHHQYFLLPGKLATIVTGPRKAFFGIFNRQILLLFFRESQPPGTCYYGVEIHVTVSLLGHSNKAVPGTEDVPHLRGHLSGRNKTLVFCLHIFQYGYGSVFGQRQARVRKKRREKGIERKKSKMKNIWGATKENKNE